MSDPLMSYSVHIPHASSHLDLFLGPWHKNASSDIEACHLYQDNTMTTMALLASSHNLTATVLDRLQIISAGLKEELNTLKAEIGSLKEEVKTLKEEVACLKEEGSAAVGSLGTVGTCNTSPAESEDMDAHEEFWDGTPTRIGFAPFALSPDSVAETKRPGFCNAYLVLSSSGSSPI